MSDTIHQAAEMVAAAYKQQKLTGRKDADVAFVIMGKWPSSGDYKRLAGRRGPLGRCVCEYEDSVLCLFKADEVIRFCAPLPERRDTVAMTATVIPEK